MFELIEIHVFNWLINCLGRDTSSVLQNTEKKLGFPTFLSSFSLEIIPAFWLIDHLKILKNFNLHSSVVGMTLCSKVALLHYSETAADICLPENVKM